MSREHVWCVQRRADRWPVYVATVCPVQEGGTAFVRISHTNTHTHTTGWWASHRVERSDTGFVRDGYAFNSNTTLHRRGGGPVVHVGGTDFLFLVTKRSVFLESDVFVVHPADSLLVGDDVVVVAAMALGLGVEAQVVVVRDVEWSQPAP